MILSWCLMSLIFVNSEAKFKIVAYRETAIRLLNLLTKEMRVITGGLLRFFFFALFCYGFVKNFNRNFYNVQTFQLFNYNQSWNFLLLKSESKFFTWNEPVLMNWYKRIVFSSLRNSSIKIKLEEKKYTLLF